MCKCTLYNLELDVSLLGYPSFCLDFTFTEVVRPETNQSQIGMNKLGNLILIGKETNLFDLMWLPNILAVISSEPSNYTQGCELLLKWQLSCFGVQGPLAIRYLHEIHFFFFFKEL